MHPDRIGPFLIDKKIGSGGMGNVYHGVHEDTGQEAAIKVLPASMAREDGFVQRFSREVEALQKLSSRHIVQLYQASLSQDDTYYYAMEYVDGETLTSVIARRKRLPWQETLDIGLQVATALKAAHDAGIIHRDLKPSNLMLAADGTVKLTDFGVAHVFATTRLTRTGGVVGTAEYMSPEQARGQRATQRSDLYSLGAVMYVMLTGRPPFTGKTANDILHKQQFAQFDKPSHYVPEIPRLLEELVCTLLEKKPDRRLPSALVLMRKLEQVRSRIEFAERQQETMSLHAADPADESRSTDETGTGSAGSDLPVDEQLASQRPGPATLVRNILREDAEAQLKKTPLARFFDNTFVLIILLALVIGSGFYFSQRSTPDPVEQLTRAQQMLNSEPGPAWLRARNDILLPLLEADSLPDHTDELQHLIRQVDQYEFTRSLKSAAPSDGTAGGEIQRLVQRAFADHSAGNDLQARQQLQDLIALTAGDSEFEFLNEFLQQTLQQWLGEPSQAGRRALLKNVLQQARQALNNEAPLEPSREALKAVLSLYTQHPGLEHELQEGQELLQQIQAQLSSN